MNEYFKWKHSMMGASSELERSLLMLNRTARLVRQWKCVNVGHERLRDNS